MAQARYLTNAPIIEAIIDFRVALAPEFNATEFAALREVLATDYPKMQERKELVTGIEVASGKVQQVLEDKGLAGYFFKSQDDKNVVQFRRDGFTFSRLNPYTEWGIVAAEAKRLWDLYASKASPRLVSRIAVRYINRLNIRLPIADFGEYLTSPPGIPQTLPLELRHFMTRVTVRDVDLDIQANIAQALDKSAKEDEIAIILDIDVYKEQETGFEESDIWPAFEKLRELKNRIFFASITDKTARLFE